MKNPRWHLVSPRVKEWSEGESNSRPLRCERTGIHSESLEKTAFSAMQTEPVTKIVTTTPNPLPLLDLIQQLAALPPEHRAALAALLAPPTTRPTAPAIDDLCPLDDRKEGAE